MYFKPAELICATIRYSIKYIAMDKMFVNGVDKSGSILDPDTILYREFEKNGLGKCMGPKVFKPNKNIFNVKILNKEKTKEVVYKFYIDRFYKEPKEIK
jgi:hypothetical protein